MTAFTPEHRKYCQRFAWTATGMRHVVAGEVPTEYVYAHDYDALAADNLRLAERVRVLQQALTIAERHLALSAESNKITRGCAKATELARAALSAPAKP